MPQGTQVYRFTLCKEMHHPPANTIAEEARNGGVMGMGELPPVARSNASLQQARNEQKRKAQAFEPVAAYGPPGSTRVME